MNHSIATGLVAAWCLLGTGSLVFAQASGSDRPFRALFGRGSQGTGGQSVDVSATLAQAYDDNLLAESGTIVPGGPTLSGQYTMLQAAGDYAWAAERVQLGLTGASAFRYYGQFSEFQSVSHSGGIGLAATLPRRTRLAVNQGAAYSPSYLSGLFPSVADVRLGDAPPASPNYNVDDLASYSYTTSASLSRSVTRRGSLTAGGDYTFTDFRGNSNGNGRRDGSSYGARVEFGRTVGRHTALSLGYRYRTGDFGSAIAGQSLMADSKSTEHGVNFGLEHTRVLSATRRALFSFGLGASGSTIPVGATGSVAEPSVATVSDRLYRVVGNGAVAYQFGRTGEIRASYRRGVEYILQLAEPVLIDGVSVSVSGTPRRRLNLSVGAGYSSGESALQATSQFDTYTASARSHFALTRVLAVYLEYLYYFYDFGANALLAPNLPRRLERNGVRVGLTLSTPLVRR